MAACCSPPSTRCETRGRDETGGRTFCLMTKGDDKGGRFPSVTHGSLRAAGGRRLATVTQILESEALELRQVASRVDPQS